MLLSMPLLPQSTVLVRRGIHRGLASAWKNKGPSTTVVLFACLFSLLQILLLGSLGAQTVRSLLVSRGDLYLEVLPNAREQDVQDLYASIGELPYVAAVEYIPKDKAYQNEKIRNPDVVAMLERFNLQNPYPDSFSVTLTSLSNYPDFAAFIGEDHWATVIDPSFLTNVTTQEQDVRRLLKIATAIRTLAFLLTGLSALCIIVCVGELIAKRTRGHGGEIVLETLLGGSSDRVIVPYVAEVTTILFLGLVSGCLVAAIGFLLIPLLSPGLVTDPSFTIVRSTFSRTLFTTGLSLLAGELLLLPILAYIGTWWGLRGVQVK
jgi:cell division protein FtsX